MTAKENTTFNEFAGKLMGLAQYKGNEQELEQPWSDIFDDAIKLNKTHIKRQKN